MTEDIRYFTPTRAEAIPLRDMARQLFSETFARLFPPKPFSALLERAYGPGGTMERDLANPSVRWLIAAHGETPIGYAKLLPLVAPAPSPLPRALELQQIYVLRPWHGKGVADSLMEWALRAAREDDAPEIYLTVFEHNERAKRFYSRYGFSEVALHFHAWRTRLRRPRVAQASAAPNSKWATTALTCTAVAHSHCRPGAVRESIELPARNQTFRMDASSVVVI